MACFLFVRCWPGFSDDFPFERFNALPDDEIGDALDRYAKERICENRQAIETEWKHRGGGAAKRRLTLSAKVADQVREVPLDSDESDSRRDGAEYTSDNAQCTATL